MYSDVDKVYRDYLDLSDTVTRKTVLAVNEGDQNIILQSLCGKLYEKIVDKADEIDYGDIPRSNGDIKKLSSYYDMKECLEIMYHLLREYKQDIGCIETISTAIENVEKRTELYVKGFRYKIDFIELNYSMIVMAIASSISFLIANCIEFIKLPNSDTFQATIDKTGLVKTKDNLLFIQVAKFNRMCSGSTYDDTLNFLIKNSTSEKGLLGIETSVVLGTAAFVFLSASLIPFMRELVFFFFYSRVKLSDYFEVQSVLLQNNAYKVQADKEIDPEKRKKIAKKQLKIAETFKNIANKVCIQSKKGEVTAYKELEKDNKKYKSSDIIDSLPDSAASKIF